MKSFFNLFPQKKPIIGMIHLPPLLGYKKSPGISSVIKHALFDLKTLETGGVDGVMVENEYDQPHQVMVGPETIAAMTVVTNAVVKSAKKRTIVGVEILLNDPKASLAVAKATNASFIRTDYFVDKMTRSEYGGEMMIDPKELLKYRKKIDAENILILADIQVKYAQMIEKKSIETSADQAKQAGADAIIVTGYLTGVPPTISDLQKTKSTIGSFPVLIGSGLDAENVGSLLSVADGAIVGTGIKSSGYVNLGKVKKLMLNVKKLRQS